MNNQEQEPDSDDDIEIYYMKPVNHYNIIQKIKEANEKLFANNSDDDKNDGKLFTTKTTQHIRRVTFAENLVEFEPNYNLDDLDDSNENEETTNPMTESMNETMIITNEEILTTIQEEEPTLMPTASDIDDNDTDNDHDDDNDTNIIESNSKEYPINMKSLIDNDSVETEEEEEEAERSSSREVLVVDMQNLGTIEDGAGDGQILMDKKTDDIEEAIEAIEATTTEQFILSNTNVEKSEAKTNDIDDEKNNDESHKDEDEDEDKDKEIETNQKKNDKEVKETEVKEEYITCNEIDDNNEIDDDISSLIPAAYIPNDNLNILKKPRIRNINTYEMYAKRKDGRKNIMFQYRSCCDYKRAHLKLPKYTGYLSEYGLSLEQKLERKQKMLERQNCSLRRKLLATELELQKMHDNEKAFTKWLKNKMRYPINKVRNMFDIRRVLSGIGRKTILPNTKRDASYDIKKIHNRNESKMMNKLQRSTAKNTGGNNNGRRTLSSSNLLNTQFYKTKLNKFTKSLSNNLSRNSPKKNP